MEFDDLRVDVVDSLIISGNSAGTSDEKHWIHLVAYLSAASRSRISRPRSQYRPISSLLGGQHGAACGRPGWRPWRPAGWP